MRTEALHERLEPFGIAERKHLETGVEPSELIPHDLLEAIVEFLSLRIGAGG